VYFDRDDGSLLCMKCAIARRREEKGSLVPLMDDEELRD